MKLGSSLQSPARSLPSGERRAHPRQRGASTRSARGTALPIDKDHADSSERWGKLRAGEHIIEFYQDAHRLSESIAAFVHAGLGSQSACIVIASPVQLQTLEQRLSIDGVDLHAARDRAQYVPLDATQLLAEILAKGWPQPNQFQSSVGSVISEAERRFERVRVFGGMVGLLWQEGKYAAAAYLDALWSELATARRFALFCAYPVPVARSESVEEALLELSRRSHEQLRVLDATLTRRVAERTDEIGRTELQFQQLVTSVSDYAIYMLDVNGNIVSWNTGAERIKGHTREEIIGKHFSVFYTEEDRAQGMPARALSVAGAEGKYEAEAWRVKKDGTRFWASVVINAIHDASGQVCGFAKITRDLTNRRDIEEQLHQSQKMEAIGQLTGGVAHDFNNLLTIILGNLETVWRELPQSDGKLRRAVDQATRGAQRAVTLTQQLLAFSRRQPLNPKPTDINRLVAGMSELVRRTIGEQIAVEAVLAGGLWVAEIDPHQLESALLNLAVNARDAMPSGGKLTIETANAYLDDIYAARYAEVKPGQYVVLCVSDTGIGMTEDTIARAFDPFFTTKPVGQGTGLGFSQVYGFVKQSGGHVKIYSEVGGGTAVKMYLPRLIGTAREEREPGMPTSLGGRRNEVVLVVEDNEDVRLYSVESLRDAGFTVLEAHDGASALGVLEQHPEISLLFTDVGLPGMDGRQLAAAARQPRPDLKVLFTTGYTRNAIVHHGRLDAGVELVTKPFTRTQLITRIRHVLDTPGERSQRGVVLMIEDEDLIRVWLGDELKEMGFDVIDATSAADGLALAIERTLLDVVIVDRGLPDRDGLQLAAELRARFPFLPVIVASGDISDRAFLAHDSNVRFLQKPFRREDLASALAAVNVQPRP